MKWKLCLNGGDVKMKKLVLVNSNYDPDYRGRDGRSSLPPAFVALECDECGLVISNKENEEILDKAFNEVAKKHYARG